MATEPQHDGERQSDLAVMDANEYKQKRRLERILDALDNVQDTVDEAWNEYVRGEITHDALNIATQRAVKNAIRECYKLLIDHHKTNDGDERYWAGESDEPIGVVEVGDETEGINGLCDFLEAPPFYQTEVTESVSQRNSPAKTVTRKVETTLPRTVSYRAYMLLKEFLDDVHDMEITFEELDDDSLPMIQHFDQSDPESNGEAGSTTANYNGPPDI